MTGIIKNLGVLIGLVVIAGLGYYLFILERDGTVDATSTTSESEIAAQDFLRRMDDIESITLTTDVFRDARFRSLESFATEVNAVPVGRQDPFSRP